MSGQRDKKSAIGEWVWRFMAFAMLLMLGYMAWVIYLLNPPPLIMQAAFEASAKAKAQSNIAQKTTAEGVIAPARPAEAAVAPAKPAAEVPPKPPAAAPAPAPAKPTAEDVAIVVEDWARAWSSKDADAYLAFYAPDFRVPGGEKREAWEKSRRQRITAPKSVSVSVDGAKVEFQGDGKASVSFRQQYKSDVLSAVTNKTLMLVLVDGRWRIQQETSGN